MAAFVIARLTFFEAARRRILLAAVLIGALFLVVYGVGLNAILTETSASASVPVLVRNEILNFFAMAGFYVVNFLTIMLSVLTSVDTLSGEISSGTIQTIVTKPMRRWEVMGGKWLGFAGLIGLYVLLMGGGITAIVRFVGGYDLTGFASGMAYLWLNGLLMLTVSLFGGAFLSTLANGVLVFGLFGVAFVGGWIEQIGSLLQNETAVQIGILTSLIMPTEALWKRAAFEMQSPLSGTIGFSPFTSGVSTPSTLMVVYAVVYLVAVLLWGMRVLSKRDL